MDWRIILSLIGFSIGLILYKKFQFRGGGVIVIPLVAVYTLSYPLMFILLAGVTAMTYVIMEYLYNRIFVYGRMLMYVGYISSLSLSLTISYLLNLKYLTLEWFPMLLCGMIAYNFHREYHSKIDTSLSVPVTIGYFVSMLVTGFGLMVFI